MSKLNDDQLRQLCEALGWQGGTFWQVLEEFHRFRATGWQMVPIEPTPEMMTAVDDAYGDGGDFPDMWAAALAAAPALGEFPGESQQESLARISEGY